MAHFAQAGTRLAKAVALHLRHHRVAPAMLSVPCLLSMPTILSEPYIRRLKTWILSRPVMPSTNCRAQSRLLQLSLAIDMSIGGPVRLCLSRINAMAVENFYLLRNACQTVRSCCWGAYSTACPLVAVIADGRAFQPFDQSPASERSDMSTPLTTNSYCQAGGSSIKSWVRDRRLLVGAAVGLGGAALWFGWPWLVLAGVVPVLVALAPCLIMWGAMCAMGACRKSATKATAAETDMKIPTHDVAEPATVVATSRCGKSASQPQEAI